MAISPEDRNYIVRFICPFVKQFLIWTLSSRIKQVLFVSFSVSTISFGAMFALFYDAEKTNEKSSDMRAEVFSLERLSDIQESIDYLELCISTNNEGNKDWYCKLAKDRYLSFVSSKSGPLLDEILDRNAYELMVVYLKDYYRKKEINIKSEKALDDHWLFIVFSKGGYSIYWLIFGSLFISLLAVSSFVYYFKKRFNIVSS